jgi:CDGSH-type Zn-finger protein
VTKVTIRKNGPARIEWEGSGDFLICDAEGAAYDLAGRTAISLCRCGQSENKPFCDGKHKECGFESEVKARVLDPLPAPSVLVSAPAPAPTPVVIGSGEPKA